MDPGALRLSGALGKIRGTGQICRLCRAGSHSRSHAAGLAGGSEPEFAGRPKGGLSAWRGQAKALRRPASAGCRSDVEAEAPSRSMHVVALKSEPWFVKDIDDVFGPNTPPACFTEGSLMPVAECSCLPWCNKSGCSFAVPPCVSCDPHGVGLGSRS